MKTYSHSVLHDATNKNHHHFSADTNGGHNLFLRQFFPHTVKASSEAREIRIDRPNKSRSEKHNVSSLKGQPHRKAQLSSVTSHPSEQCSPRVISCLKHIPKLSWSNSDVLQCEILNNFIRPAIRSEMSSSLTVMRTIQKRQSKTAKSEKTLQVNVSAPKLFMSVLLNYNKTFKISPACSKSITDSVPPPSPKKRQKRISFASDDHLVTLYEYPCDTVISGKVKKVVAPSPSKVEFCRL